MPGNSDILNIIFWIKSKWSSNIKLRTDINKEYYGKYSSKQSLSIDFKEYFNSNGRTVHMTLIFNIVVIYTSFKQINCRIIFDSFNIFKRIINSSLFSLITLGEMSKQTLIVLFWKINFQCDK